MLSQLASVGVPGLNLNRTQELAAAFDSQLCRQSIGRSRPIGHWLQAINSDVRDKRANNHGVVSVSVDERHAVYVSNEKAASLFLYTKIGELLGATSETRPFTPLSAKFNLTGSSFAMTFVRDPWARLLSGYSEVTINKEPGQAGAYRSIPCQPAHTTERFLTFLEELRNASRLGPEIQHAFPQALLINVIYPRQSAMGGVYYYDAIGRVETARADLDEIRSRMARRPALSDELWNRTNSDPQVSHSHKGNPCTHGLDLSDARVAGFFCSMYEVDYACFNYPLPRACIINRVA
jgi:hypothetical protein